ncbi:DUF4855 domain-containing protein [Marinicrinis lubricantis]|uniref:DUF4855 domain-containing protein n=1 Tax=Marinicrinis lubricantis TaxID=2086470 RepID=A0ABW1IL07_9BACL
MPETDESLCYLSPDKLNIHNHLCVLPCGGLSEKDDVKWTEKELEPAVWYLLEGKRVDRMFGGFVFNAISCRKDRYLYPLYMGFGELPDMEDWKEWINTLFRGGENLHALQSLANRPLDVWVSVPYPHHFQEQFGVVNGKMLDFRDEEDRFQAVKWWIDLFMQRWNAEQPVLSHLNFRGFLWARESVDEGDTGLAKRYNAYVKEKGAHSLWLPNYGTYGIVDSSTLGFDVTLVNPNYYGNTPYGMEWIQHTSDFAQIYHTGMQVIFGKGFVYNDVHLLDYLNFGLPEYKRYMTKTLIAYQFPNQTVRTIYEQRFVDYIRIYSFIKGIYAKVNYPGITY